MATPLTEIPDHLLAEILLRLPAPGDLARASAACVCFRRLVTDGSFLRRFRRLHTPPLLGFLDCDGFNPTLPPVPGARALEHAADFSFTFLPSHCRWTVEDTRDGCVLLDGTPHDQEIPVVVELVVCDPLHRRYILLPTPSDELVPMVRKARYRTFLVPLYKEDTAAAEDTAFRVIWMAHCEINLSACVFSSSTGQWRAATSKPWSDLVLGRAESNRMSQILPYALGRHYAYGFFYWDWSIFKIEKLLVRDTRRMEFSIAGIPPGDWSTMAIVEAGEGRLGIFGFHDGITTSDLSYTIARNKGERPSQWQVEQTISPDSGYNYYIRDATERYLLLTRTETPFQENQLTEYFSMDVKTLQLQRLSAKQCRLMYGTRLYTNFSLSLLSSATVRSDSVKSLQISILSSK